MAAGLLRAFERGRNWVCPKLALLFFLVNWTRVRSAPAKKKDLFLLPSIHHTGEHHGPDCLDANTVRGVVLKYVATRRRGFEPILWKQINVICGQPLAKKSRLKYPILRRLSGTDQRQEANASGICWSHPRTRRGQDLRWVSGKSDQRRDFCIIYHTNGKCTAFVFAQKARRRSSRLTKIEWWVNNEASKWFLPPVRFRLGF